ncbi:related to TAM domain methyltransferase [Fusarium fujikuroi]|nr:related to TAM domain methyltransferase [Fusarium fujikuroi]SCO12294.1 related to TAM domain methyltransferase [Fusarium fujikuroi]SCO22668.1 related to TAM domain methyltransferase [Fusarium fujikuroi]SCV57127.1 related to TAM domain methyltransferase [Fusarium fujikuroi]
MADNSPQDPAATATTQPEGHLEVDDDLGANDSLYQSTIGGSSFLSSLNSSIYNYSSQNGRRYHAFREGTYPVPNDEDEQDRMDLVHHVYSILLDGKLHLAPIGANPQRVLDLGTGTGIWAIDFADEHPSAEVIGNDLSPIQPEWNPPNCTFEVDDFEDEWLYRSEFDFVHARELEACVGDEDLMLQRAFRHIRSNGYIELQGVDARFESDDGTLDKAPSAKSWMKHLIEACAKFGKPVDCADKWKDRLIKAGLVDVQQDVRKLPIGPWPKDPKLKELGRYQAIQESKVIDSYTPKLFEYALGWSAEEIQVLMAQVKNELRNPGIHLYLPVYFVWGRKP